jgi:uncharacterized membrane protein
MRLTETGETRIQGYLYMLSRALRTPSAAAFADDALKEVESHIRERLREEADGDERAVVERVLREVGTPQRVAEAYSSEMTLEEAVTTGRFLAVTRAVWHAATTSAYGFAWAMAAFTGWVLSISVALLAPLRVLFPNNVGVFYLNGQVHSAGAIFGGPAGLEARPFGYWIVPVALVLGAGIMVATHRASRRVLGWIRARKAPAHIRVRVEVSPD